VKYCLRVEERYDIKELKLREGEQENTIPCQGMRKRRNTVCVGEGLGRSDQILFCTKSLEV
jgi:hypothetical protein